jgi:hypothetical protein
MEMQPVNVSGHAVMVPATLHLSSTAVTGIDGMSEDVAMTQAVAENHPHELTHVQPQATIEWGSTVVILAVTLVYFVRRRIRWAKARCRAP